MAEDKGTENALREMVGALFLTPEQRENFFKGTAVDESNVLTEVLKSEITRRKIELEKHGRTDTMRVLMQILRVDIERAELALAGDSNTEQLDAYNALVRHYYF